jgi:hypothetical protein
MTTITIESNNDNAVARLGEITPRVRAAVSDVVGVLQAELVDIVRARAPVRTGAYRDSIKGSLADSATGSIARVAAEPGGAGSAGSRKTFYAPWIEYGATIPAHDIAPAGKIMKFDGGAGDVFRRVIHSPGGKIKAQEIIHGAFEEKRGDIVARIKAAALEHV